MRKQNNRLSVINFGVIIIDPSNEHFWFLIKKYVQFATILGISLDFQDRNLIIPVFSIEKRVY